MEITIREMHATDAEKFQEAVLESVEHVSPWLAWCTPDYSIEDATAWAESAADTWRNGTDYRFAIEDRDEGRVLGCVGINQVVPQHRIGNLGYWVRRTALNQGVCTRAARLVVDYAFRELNFQRIEIHVHPDNIASNAVAAKLGGRYEGVFLNKLYFNGAATPAKCYAIIPDDYQIPQI